MKKVLQDTFQIAQSIVEREEASAPVPPLSPEDVRGGFDLRLPKIGLGESAALGKVGEVVAVTPSTSSRRFYNQLFAGREPLAGAAEMLTGLLNSSMYTFKVAGVHTMIETEVVSRLCQLVGFEQGDGTFVPGGSMGNLVGMLLAAYEARPGLRDEGLSGPRLRIYSSAESHYSVRKNAGMLGLGRGNVSRVQVDSQGRLDSVDLERRIAADRAAGYQPFCVIGTAGTTVAGAFDPLMDVADIAEREGLWFHVDAAFGGTYLLHPEHREKLKGIERADSCIWNAHKMMGIPLPCAAVLVREPGMLHKHFSEAADYLFQQDSEDLNLGTKSIQCGRRNDSFKLWAAWQKLGDDGWCRRIDDQVTLTKHARDFVVQHEELELALEPESITLCFVAKGRSSEAVCEELGARGLAQVGYGVVAGRKVIRLVTANPEVTTGDLDRFFSDLLRVVADLPTLAGPVLDGPFRKQP